MAPFPSPPPAVLEDRPGWGTQSHPGLLDQLWREGCMARQGEAALALFPTCTPICSVQKGRICTGPGPPPPPANVAPDLGEHAVQGG